MARDGRTTAPPVAPSAPVQWLHGVSKGGVPLAVSRRNGEVVEFSDEPSNSHDGLRECSVTEPSATSRIPEPEPPETPATPSAPSGLLQHAFVRRILRYCSVSVVSTVIGLTVLGVLVGVFGWPAVWANVVATAIALAPSFELSRRWVWAHDGRRSMLRQAAPYAAVSFAGLIVSSIAVHLASNATSTSTRFVHTAAVLLANVAAYGTLWVVQFVVCDRILFRSRARPGQAPEDSPPRERSSSDPIRPISPQLQTGT